MKELPGDVFVSAQIMPEQIKALTGQGIAAIINNRPDMEAPMQPFSDEILMASKAENIDYTYIPMGGNLTHELIEASIQAYETMPRPIFAYCASGTRSTILWCFAHAEKLGVDAVLDGASKAGYDLEHFRGGLTQFLESRAT